MPSCMRGPSGMSYRLLEQGASTMRGAVPKFSNARWRTCCLRFATVKLLLCSPKSENLELTWNGLDLGEVTVGENVATTLLTPLAEGEEAEMSFSPTLMVVLTALACEYAGRIPVSPLQLLRGLSRMLLSYSGPCVRRLRCFRACLFINLCYSIDTGSYPSGDDAISSRMPKDSPRTNLRRPTPQEHIRSPYITSLSSSTFPRHWPLMRRNHQRCSQFEDMTGKLDELRAAVANSRSRSVRTVVSGQMFICIDANNNIVSASRLPPCARIQAASASSFTSPQFLTHYIAIIPQRDTEAPVCSLRPPTTRSTTSSAHCDRHAIHRLFGFLR